MTGRSIRFPVSADPIQQTQDFNARHRIDEGEQIAYGYKDGGRRVPFGPDGAPLVRSSREIIAVRGPAEDPVLASVIGYACAQLAQIGTVEEKARWLKDYVAALLKENNESENSTILDRLAGGDCRGVEISLGQMIVAGTGVCRHRSLLFKMMADAAGIPAALVRGGYREDGSYGGGHAWNEIVLENGTRMIVDVMHNFMGGLTTEKAGYYQDIRKTPLYPGPLPQAGTWVEATKKGETLAFVSFDSEAEAQKTLAALARHGIAAEITRSSNPDIGLNVRVGGKAALRLLGMEEPAPPSPALGSGGSAFLSTRPNPTVARVAQPQPGAFR